MLAPETYAILVCGAYTPPIWIKRYEYGTWYWYATGIGQETPLHGKLGFTGFPGTIRAEDVSASTTVLVYRCVVSNGLSRVV